MLRTSSSVRPGWIRCASSSTFLRWYATSSSITSSARSTVAGSRSALAMAGTVHAGPPILQRVILPSFRHRPGLHCGSTALCDALRARGLELSEPLAFGLGAGLGFHYVVAPELTPSHFLIGRSAGLERTACEVLGAPMA